MVPRLYKFYFQLLSGGDRNFICEHDIFIFMQELEGKAPVTLPPKKMSSYIESKINDTLMEEGEKKDSAKNYYFLNWTL